jgi:ABC-type cobalamin/Fe3+-siderophores transport system ATPase subunit
MARTRVARALAQEPEALVLDEPTAALDVRHEMEVFELIRELVGTGLGAIVVTHHLNLAARYADRMLLLEEGRVAAEGRPDAVLTEAVVARVFDWPVAVIPRAMDHRKWCRSAGGEAPMKRLAMVGMALLSQAARSGALGGAGPGAGCRVG